MRARDQVELAVVQVQVVRVVAAGRVIDAEASLAEVCRELDRENQPVRVRAGRGRAGDGRPRGVVLAVDVAGRGESRLRTRCVAGRGVGIVQRHRGEDRDADDLPGRGRDQHAAGVGAGRRSGRDRQAERDDGVATGQHGGLAGQAERPRAGRRAGRDGLAAVRWVAGVERKRRLLRQRARRGVDDEPLGHAAPGRHRTDLPAALEVAMAGPERRAAPGAGAVHDDAVSKRTHRPADLQLARTLGERTHEWIGALVPGLVQDERTGGGVGQELEGRADPEERVGLGTVEPRLGLGREDPAGLVQVRPGRVHEGGAEQRIRWGGDPGRAGRAGRIGAIALPVCLEDERGAPRGGGCGHRRAGSGRVQRIRPRVAREVVLSDRRAGGRLRRDDVVARRREVGSEPDIARRPATRERGDRWRLRPDATAAVVILVGGRRVLPAGTRVA